MSERAFVCQLTLLNIDTYTNILIDSSINTNEMYSRINEKRVYVIDITFSINESIFSGNEQQKVYLLFTTCRIESSFESYKQFPCGIDCCHYYTANIK